MLYRVVDALQGAGVAFAIAGGWAVALHGAVRGTVGLDLVVRLDPATLRAAAEALERLGYVSRLPVGADQVFAFRREYLQNRGVRAWEFWDPSAPAEVVALLLTHDLSRLRIRRVRAAGRSLPVLSAPDLLRMKRESGRPQDLEDARALERLEA